MMIVDFCPCVQSVLHFCIQPSSFILLYHLEASCIRSNTHTSISSGQWPKLQVFSNWFISPQAYIGLMFFQYFFLRFSSLAQLHHLFASQTFDTVHNVPHSAFLFSINLFSNPIVPVLSSLQHFTHNTLLLASYYRSSQISRDSVCFPMN